MNPALNINNIFEKLYKRVTAKRSDQFVYGIAIYTLMFALGCVMLILPAVKETGTVLAGDGVDQYYPVLIALRRYLIEFFDNVSHGSFEFPMVDFYSMFGNDTINGIPMYFPFLPYYIFSVLVPETFVDDLLTGGIILSLFGSGLSFFNLCRHFDVNLLWAGLFASFYAFCGNAMAIVVWNPHFFVMMIAFPFMIIGIDNIIKGKSGLALTLAVAWTGLGGLVFLIYILPFAFVFAIIRMIYLKNGKYVLTLIRGILHVVVGVMVSGVVMLPGIIFVLTAERPLGGAGISMWEMFVPSVEYMSELIDSKDINAPLSVCAATVPAFMYTLISPKAKSEYRCYSIVLFILVALPIIRYGLNGFMYDLCRWGFIPALYMCFMGAALMPKILRTDGCDALLFAVGLSVVLLCLLLKIALAGIMVISALAVINCVSKLRSGLSVFSGSIYDRIFGKRNVNALILLLIVAVIGAVCGVLIYFKIFEDLTALTIVFICLMSALIPNISGKESVTSMMSALLAAAFIIADVNYAGTMDFLLCVLGDTQIYMDIAFSCKDSDIFNRYHNIKDENRYFIIHNSKSDTDDEDITEIIQTNNVLAQYDNFYILSDDRTNLGMRCSMADAEGFLSGLNVDLFRLLTNCGQDKFSFGSAVQFNGFSGKEPLYSLFGINYMYGAEENDSLFGIRKIEAHGRILDLISVYHNDYALPNGITYDSAYTREWYNSQSPATLPFAMMDGVYLEGYDNIADSDKTYTAPCDYVLSHNVTGHNEFGSETSENTITINSDVSGCFLYLTMNGVSAPAEQSKTVKTAQVETDTGRTITLSVETGNWNWRRNCTEYTFALGFSEEDISTLSFNCDFDFDPDTLTVTAVPLNVFTDAYRARTECTMHGLSMGTNTISGEIDTPTDKILTINFLYSDGWTAYVDGETAPLYKANGIFIGIPLSAGHHDIRLVYRTPWLFEGAVISVIGIAITVIGEIVLKKRSKKS